MQSMQINSWRKTIEKKKNDKENKKKINTKQWLKMNKNI